jgi:hypothetical protein
MTRNSFAFVVAIPVNRLDRMLARYRIPGIPSEATWRVIENDDFYLILGSSAIGIKGNNYARVASVRGQYD